MLASAVAALLLFLVSLAVMREGVRGLAPLGRGCLSVSNTLDRMGFGWLGAYLILSGSPMATDALAKQGKVQSTFASCRGRRRTSYQPLLPRSKSFARCGRAGDRSSSIRRRQIDEGDNPSDAVLTTWQSAAAGDTAALGGTSWLPGECHHRPGPVVCSGHEEGLHLRQMMNLLIGD